MVAQLPLTVPDAVCFDDLDPLGRDTTSDLETLAQDVYHVLVETLGSNLDDLNRGLGVEDMLSGSTRDLATLARRTENELLKDSRVSTCSATLTKETDGSFTLAIEIGVGADVVGLATSFTHAAGLRLTGWTVNGVEQ